MLAVHETATGERSDYFSEAHFEHIIDLGCHVLNPDAEPYLERSQPRLQLLGDPEAANLLHDALSSDTHAIAAATMLDQILALKGADYRKRGFSSFEVKDLVNFGQAIAFHDEGRPLLHAIANQTDPAIRNRLTDLLLRAFTIAGPNPNPYRVASLVRPLFLERVQTACTDSTEQYESIDEQIDRYYRAASSLHYNTIDKQDQLAFAGELLAMMRAQPSGGLMHRLVATLMNSGAVRFSLFKHFGLDEYDTFSAWVGGYGQWLLPDNTPDPTRLTQDAYMDLCVERILNVERQRPGGVNLLHRRLLFENFGRFSEDMLTGLVDRMGKPVGRVVLAAIAQQCPNGAMLGFGNRLTVLQAKLPDDVLLLPMEASCSEDIVKQLRLFQRVQRLSGVRVAGLILSAHGIDGKARLAKKYAYPVYEDHWLEPSDFNGPLGDLLAEVCEPDITAIVTSCRGLKIAKALHERLNIRVLASAEEAGVRKLGITSRPNSDVLDMELGLAVNIATKDNKWQSQPTQTVVFEPTTSA